MTDETQTPNTAAHETLHRLAKATSDLDRVIPALGEKHGATTIVSALLFTARTLLRTADDLGTGPEVRLNVALLCRLDGQPNPFPEVEAIVAELLAGVGEA